MGTPKTDFAHLFPPHERVAEAVRASAPLFFVCPEGHRLPRRLPHGRCTPAGCVGGPPPVASDTYAAERALTPLGCENTPPMTHEGASIARGEAIKAQHEEALVLMRIQGVMAARDALMGVPKPPPVPDFKTGGRAAVVQYLEDLAPLAAAKLGQRLCFGTPKEQIDAAQEVLDRAGFPRRKDALPQLRAPITINLGGVTLPYEKQGRTDTDEAYLAVVARSRGGGVQGAKRAGEEGARSLLPSSGQPLPWGAPQNHDRSWGAGDGASTPDEGKGTHSGSHQGPR